MTYLIDLVDIDFLWVILASLAGDKMAEDGKTVCPKQSSKRLLTNFAPLINEVSFIY